MPSPEPVSTSNLRVAKPNKVYHKLLLREVKLFLGSFFKATLRSGHLFLSRAKEMKATCLVFKVLMGHRKESSNTWIIKFKLAVAEKCFSHDILRAIQVKKLLALGCQLPIITTPWLNTRVGTLVSLVMSKRS